MSLQWWAYQHVNGEVHLKRYWDDPKDIKTAKESPFVKRIYMPFEAENYEEAEKLLIETIKERIQNRRSQFANREQE